MNENDCFLQCGWGTTVSFTSIKSATIEAYDPDSINLTIDILSLPLKGTIGYKKTSASNELTVLSSISTFSMAVPWTFWLQPLVNEHSPGCDIGSNTSLCMPYQSIPFVIRDEHNSSSVYYIHFYVFPINLPPGSVDASLYVPEDVDTNIPLDNYVWDTDGINSDLTVFIFGFSAATLGSVRNSSGSFITSNNTPFKLSDKIIRYTPPLHQYSTQDPMAKIKFYSMDKLGDVSKVSTLSVWVTPVPHAVEYYGELEKNVLENSEALIFVGRRDIDWTSIDIGTGQVTITTLSSLGIWKLCTAAGASSCININNSSCPFVLYTSQVFSYTPPKYQYGSKYANFTFNIRILESYNTNDYYFKYIINVIHVNQPPAIIPLWTSLVCDEDTYLKFSLNVTDIDSPLSSLFLRVMDFKSIGTLYLCNTTDTRLLPNNTCVNDLEIKLAGQTFYSPTPGHYTFSFVPKPNANGDSRYIFAVYDDYQLLSNSSSVPISVREINDPPTFTARVFHSPEHTLTPASRPYAVSVMNGQTTTIVDIDFYDKEMNMTITANFGYFEVTGGGNSKNSKNTKVTCENKDNHVICIGNRVSLSSFISNNILYLPHWTTAPFDPPTTNRNLTYYRNITFSLNDLGNIDYRGLVASLTTTQTVTISIPLSGVDDGLIAGSTSSSTAMSIAVGIGLLVAILLGILAALFFRKSRDAVDTYLADFLSNSAAEGVNQSPFYTPATRVVQSRLYATSANAPASGE
eukprot:TRINITY_DN3926_c0_g2_i1.p1 TRINITY_DN3926_c0_g2~~TRINITY_DN3926_c0_g2_i1.p1  ORF type:complete len:799 (-),score=133.86 TRINITY_DN3926_c0_g2_i1:68-2299(-)